MFIGAQAVQTGLADRVGSLKKLITEFSMEKNPFSGSFVAANATPESLLTQEKKLMDIEAFKQEHPDWVAQLRQEGATAEKQRLRDILSGEEAKDREKGLRPLAQEIAFNTDLSVKEALQLLACVPLEEVKGSIAKST